MDEKTKNQIFIASCLTIISTFLMGLIDAYTFIEQDGSFASAQTGNIVTFSVKLFMGKYGSLMSHVVVFVGYALGAFIGEAVIEKLNQTALYKSRSILLIQAVLLGFLAVFQNVLNDSMMIFCLGLLAGYEITVFRQLRTTTVNNGVMTGNTKNMMNNLYQALFNKSKQARAAFLHFLFVIFVFIIGAGTGVLITQVSENLLLWIAFLIILISFLLTYLDKYRENYIMK